MESQQVHLICTCLVTRNRFEAKRFIATRTMGGLDTLSCSRYQKKTESHTHKVVIFPQPSHTELSNVWITTSSNKIPQKGLRDVEFPAHPTLPHVSLNDKETIHKIMKKSHHIHILVIGTMCLPYFWHRAAWPLFPVITNASVGWAMEMSIISTTQRRIVGSHSMTQYWRFRVWRKQSNDQIGVGLSLFSVVQKAQLQSRLWKLKVLNEMIHWYKLKRCLFYVYRNWFCQYHSQWRYRCGCKLFG